ncbi:MAG: lamin tail domain-containing protein [Phycisphaerae bacterium]|jgi:hypothetical protein
MDTPRAFSRLGGSSTRRPGTGQNRSFAGPRPLRPAAARLGLAVIGAALSAGWPAALPALAGESYACRVADLDHDGDVDQVDFGRLQACFSNGGGQTPPACQALSLDGDADVDGDDLAFFASCASGPATPLPPGRLLIAELMASNSATIRDPDQTSDQYPDWIELYNDDSEPKDLGGLYLTNDPGSPTLWPIPAGVTIAAGGRLLIWADAEPEQGPTHAGFKLDKDGQTVALFAADGQTRLDGVTFGPLGTDVSWGRLPDAAETWRAFAGPFAPPTPGRPNADAVGAPRVLISEIMYHPYAPEFTPEPLGEEFIELYNAGSTLVDLGGWKFTKGIGFTIPAGEQLAPGEYLVVAGSVPAFQARYPGVSRVVGGWTKRLSNDGEELELVDAAGRVIDRVDYSDHGDWAVRQRGPLDHGHSGWVWYSPADGGGPSLELVNLALSNDFGHNWSPSLVAGGTPGGHNSTASSDAPPIIGDVEQSPVIPHSDQPVVMTAQIIDEDVAGLAVKVYYRKDGTVPFTAVTLLDDGQSGDGPAGDGVFGCSLPAQPDGTIIEYYIEARDAGGRVRRQPAFAQPADAPLTNRLYRVDDAFDPAAWQPGQPPLYYLIMTAAERAELADIGDSNTDGISEQESNAQMNATFVSLDADGVKARYNVGVRNRGKGSRDDPPNNYRVNFVHEHSWNGLTELDINSKYTWLQHLGAQLFKSAGLPAAETMLVQVRVNGQNLAETGTRMYGAYVRLESLNGEFAHRQFPADDSGNMYRCARWDGPPLRFADFTYLGTDPAAYRPMYSKETHGSEEDWADLIRLTDVLTNAPAARYEQDVAGVVNVDQWLRWFAFQCLLGNNETNPSNGVGDDYSMYRGVLDPRFVLLPHDLDTILGTGNGTPAKTTDSIWLAAAIPNLKRFLQHPAYCPRYYAQLRELAATVFSDDGFAAVADAALAGLVPQAVIDARKSFVAARRAYVLAQIPAALTIHSDLPFSGGYYRSTQPTAALDGQGNAFETRSVRVNGQPADWDPVAGTWRKGRSSILIPRGSVWSYLDTGTPPPADWTEPGFDEQGWKSGKARLGYGGDGEVTTLSYGPNANNKYITYWFRHSFDVGDTSAFTNLKVRIARDDGAVVYVNGPKAFGSNMPEVFGPNTPASSLVNTTTAEQTYYEYDVNPSMLIPHARNVVAVEVHQINNTSTDLGFDLELEAQGSQPVIVDGLPLTPGLNHVVVQTFTGPDGTGQEVESGAIDIWYDDGAGPVLAGAITADRTLSAAAGPYRVTGDVSVQPGVTLTLEPGVVLFFEPGAGLTVAGRLLAEGTETDHVRLLLRPGAAGSWDGLAFNNTLADNRLIWVDVAHGDGQGHSIEVNASRLLIDHVSWSGTNVTLIEMNHPSVIIQNSTFPSISGAELVHGEWLSGAEYLIIRNNVFGTTTGYNDVIDFSGCKRPGPILQVLDNVFEGGGDDAVDMDGTDAHLEGNVFMHFHKNNSSSSSSNALATGRWSTSGQSSDVTVVRNLFFDNDHALLLKEGCFARFENNTVVGSVIAAINYGEPERGVAPGLGAAIENTIFWNNAATFQNVIAGVQISMNYSIAPAAEHGYGVGNLDADPLFVDPPADFHLQPGSPALGSAPGGGNRGAY